jgi:hypothetical protein
MYLSKDIRKYADEVYATPKIPFVHGAAQEPRARRQGSRPARPTLQPTFCVVSSGTEIVDYFRAICTRDVRDIPYFVG